MLRPLILAALLAVPAAAQEVVTQDFDGSFDEANFALENAIIGQGLVVDHVSHVGDMLSRTKGDVGGEETLFENADVYQFCSAVTSRNVMEADPLNIAYCPYGIFVIERAGKVQIGYRTYPEGAMDEVETLLSDIVAEATGF